MTFLDTFNYSAQPDRRTADMLGVEQANRIFEDNPNAIGLSWDYQQ